MRVLLHKEQGAWTLKDDAERDMLCFDDTCALFDLDRIRAERCTRFMVSARKVNPRRKGWKKLYMHMTVFGNMYWTTYSKYPDTGAHTSGGLHPTVRRLLTRFLSFKKSDRQDNVAHPLWVKIELLRSTRCKQSYME